MSPHVIVGWMILALCAVGLIWTIDHYRAWFRYQAVWGWTFCAEYVRAGRPEQRTLAEYTDEKYADDLDFDDDLTIGEAVASVPELDLDGTQPIEQVYQDPPPGSPVLVPVQGDWVPVTYEPPIPEDVPRPSPVSAAEGATSANAGPGYLPFQPHAGPPAWQPRHAKTSWLDELITDCLGAPSVEIYMWNWQQRHRLAVTA